MLKYITIFFIWLETNGAKMLVVSLLLCGVWFPDANNNSNFFFLFIK